MGVGVEKREARSERLERQGENPGGTSQSVAMGVGVEKREARSERLERQGENLGGTSQSAAMGVEGCRGLGRTTMEPSVVPRAV